MMMLIMPETTDHGQAFPVRFCHTASNAIFAVALATASASAHPQGFGSDTPGGDGRNPPEPGSRVLVVSTLNDFGEGSLRDAVEEAGPRTIVFAVSGSIQLRRPLKIKNPYVTIAGETAPSPGIAVNGDRTEIGTHDVIIRHMRFFVGDAPGGTKGSDRDALAVSGEAGRAENILVDHCFIGGAIDENFSTYGDVGNVTISNSIIANSLDQPLSSAAHSKGHHGKGILIGKGTRNFSIIRCLIANNHDRNPRINPGAEGEIINNVIYGWGGSSGWNLLNVSDADRNPDTPVRINVIGNTWIAGPDGRCDVPFLYDRDFSPETRLFLADNLSPSCPPKLKTKKAEPPRGIQEFVAHSHPIPLSPGLKILEREKAKEFVLENAGARRRDSFSDDLILIREVKDRTGRIKAGIWGMPESGVSYPLIPSGRVTLPVPRGGTNLEQWLKEYRARVENPGSP